MNSKLTSENIKIIKYFLREQNKSEKPNSSIKNLLTLDLLYNVDLLVNDSKNTEIIMPAPKKMKILRIFIASEGILFPERDLIENLFRKENDKFILDNVYLKPERWEQKDPGNSLGRKQAELNEYLKESEIAIFILWRRAGIFSKEEFELAYQSMMENLKPKRIYIFDKNLPRDHITEAEKLSSLAYEEIKNHLYGEKRVVIEYTELNHIKDKLHLIIDNLKEKHKDF